MNKSVNNSVGRNNIGSLLRLLNELLKVARKKGIQPDTVAISGFNLWLADVTTDDKAVWEERSNTLAEFIKGFKAELHADDKAYVEALDVYRAALLRNIDYGLNVLEDPHRTPAYQVQVGDGLKSTMALLDSVDQKLSNLDTVNKGPVALAELKRATRIINLITEAY